MKRGTVDSKVTLSSYYRERPRPNTNTFLFSFCLTFLTVTVMLLALDLASKCSTLWYRLWCLCSPSFRNNDKQTELDLVEVRPASELIFWCPIQTWSVSYDFPFRKPHSFESSSQRFVVAASIARHRRLICIEN